MKPIPIFIGFDPRQPIAFQVLAHSVWKHAGGPVSITRLDLRTLPIKRVGLTEFTYSRFLVPWLCDYEGTAIFIDSDFLCRDDLYILFAYPLAYPTSNVFVAKNQLRFEWPSLMVFNNEQCKMLTPDFVDNPANKLFDFAWATDVGQLPLDWNHLVGYDNPNEKAKLVHYTQGIPCWPETKGCEFTEEWQKVHKETNSTVSFQDLMARSVHAEHVYKRLAEANHAGS